MDHTTIKFTNHNPNSNSLNFIIERKQATTIKSSSPRAWSIMDRFTLQSSPSESEGDVISISISMSSSPPSEDGNDSSSSNVGIYLFLFLLLNFCWLALLVLSSLWDVAATPCDDASVCSSCSSSPSVGSMPVIHSLSSSSKTTSWTGFSMGSLSLLSLFYFSLELNLTNTRSFILSWRSMLRLFVWTCIGFNKSIT